MVDENQNIGETVEDRKTEQGQPSFVEGQSVRCIDAAMEGCGPALDEGRIYTVRKFTPPSECAPHVAQWEKNGGRMELTELPGGSGAGFYGRRFRAV